MELSSSSWPLQKVCADGAEDQINSRNTAMWLRPFVQRHSNQHFPDAGCCIDKFCGRTCQLLPHHFVQGFANNLELASFRKEQMAMLPIDALSFQLLPAARASNANITGAGIPSLSKTTSRGNGQQQDVQSFRNAITTSIGSNLLRTHWFMSHPLKNSHRLPIRSPIHFLFENNSRVRNLVSHSLILLRLTQPFSLLRLKLKPVSSKCTDDSDLYDGQGYAEVEREIAAMFGNLMGVVPARAIAYLEGSNVHMSSRLGIRREKNEKSCLWPYKWPHCH